jgi:poly(3-hydroxyalkanoate) synthetase
VEHLFRDNKLIKGTLEVGGKVVNMRNITCPVFLLAGKRDHITPPPQVFEMEKYIGTPPQQIEKYLVQAGHIGLFMGREILRDTWSEIGAHMYRYSLIEQADETPQILQSA